jgi:hypothetical protein
MRVRVPVRSSAPTTSRPGRPGALVAALGLSAVLAGACAPAVAPLPAPAPAPRDPPSVPAPSRVDRRIAIAPQLPAARYRVAVRTVLQSEEPAAAGRPGGTSAEEVVLAEATITLRGERSWSAAVGPDPWPPGALRASGRVDGFRLTASPRVQAARPGALATPAPAADSLPAVTFDAVLDSVLARIAPTPALVNECDQPSVAAAGLARELLVRLPETIETGAAWRDSARVFTCRGGVPITLYLANETRVVSIAADGRSVTLRRTVRTRVEGQLVLAWRTITLRGSGEATSTLALRLPDGTADQVTGTGVLRFEARDSARPTARETLIVQRTQYEAARLAP